MASISDTENDNVIVNGNDNGNDNETKQLTNEVKQLTKKNRKIASKTMPSNTTNLKVVKRATLNSKDKIIKVDSFGLKVRENTNDRVKYGCTINYITPLCFGGKNDDSNKELLYWDLNDVLNQLAFNVNELKGYNKQLKLNYYSYVRNEAHQYDGNMEALRVYITGMNNKEKARPYINKLKKK